MGQMPEDTRPDPGKRKEVTLDPGKMMSQLPATSDRGKLGSSEVQKAIQAGAVNGQNSIQGF